MIETIRMLAECYGPSGHEHQIRDLILQEVKSLADDVKVDALGNIIAWRRSDVAGAPRVMLDAHMDEIGLIVTHVDGEGFLRFTALGALYPLTLVGNRVRFEDGTIGVIAAENRTTSTVPVMSDLYIDISDGSKSSRIGVGAAGGMLREVVVRGDRIIGKSLDDRVGCAIQIEVMRRLASLPNDVAFVFSVQEEVGLRGARTAAYGVEPDLGIAIDVTLTGDTPKGPKLPVALGKGPAIKVMDAQMLASPAVIRLMEETARRIGIPYQKEILIGGSTDAAVMQLSHAGIQAGCVSIPCRYVHTTSETVSLSDVENAVSLVIALLEQPVDLT